MRLLRRALMFFTLIAGTGFGSACAITTIPSDTLLVDGLIQVVHYDRKGRIEEKQFFNESWEHLYNQHYYYYKSGEYEFITRKKGPFSKSVGPRKRFYPDGSVKTEGFSSNGKIEGPTYAYYQTGEVLCECRYSQGKRQGVQRSYWQNGVLYAETMYEQGKLDGRQIFHYENGQLWAVAEFKKGRLMHISELYSSAGGMLDPGSLRDGNGLFNEYDEFGKLVTSHEVRKGRLPKPYRKEWK